MEKYHKQDVAPIEKENERDENYEASNPQIDSERTKNNYRFTPHFGKTYTEFINGRIKELGLSPRKDAVVMNSFVLGSDKTFFDGLVKVEQYNFFSDCYKFFAERYGEENIIAAVVHNDETTPHMHLNLMPVTKDGRLCSKQLFDKPQLQQLQTDFYEVVGKKYGLKRGKEGSTAKHLDTVAFKTKKMTEAAEEKIREAEKAQTAAKPVKELLESYEWAKSEKIPFSGEKKETEIIALRMKNSELEKQNNVLAKDNGDLYDELKRSEGDNPTIGIVLCSDTDEDIARYSVMHGNEQLFASKYKLYLPTEEELRAEIETQKTMYYLQHDKDENNQS